MAAWARAATLLAALLHGATAAEELFELGMDDAREHARLDERPIFVYLIPSRLKEREQARLADEPVAGLLRGFHAVQVDEVRDRELFESYSAGSSNPTFVVLAADGLELHRWCGWMPASRFAVYLAEAVERNARYMGRQPWDVPNHLEPWEDEGFDLPEGGPARALAASRQRLWCLQENGVLLDLDPLKGETRDRLSIPSDVWTDLAADDDELYVLPYGWTRGEAILRLDLRTGTIDRGIVTEDNRRERSYSAYGLALAGEWLYVAHDGLTISKVDRASGRVVARLHVDGARYGLFALGALEHDGAHLVALGRAKRPGNLSAPRDGVALIEPESGRVVDFKILDFPVNGLALHGGGYLTADRELVDICRPGSSRGVERMRIRFFWP